MAKFRFYELLLIWILNQEKFIFEWDEGNRTKIVDKHQINCGELESAFDASLIETLGIQMSPKVSEERYGILSVTANGKNVFIVFTIRNSKVRIISARKMNRKEQKNYEILRKKS